MHQYEIGGVVFFDLAMRFSQGEKYANAMLGDSPGACPVWFTFRHAISVR